MKKITIIIAAVMGLTVNVNAQFLTNNGYSGGGLFGRGLVSDEVYYGAGVVGQSGLFNNDGLPGLPDGHDMEGDQPAPLGSGVLLLVGLSAAYLMKQKRKKE